MNRLNIKDLINQNITILEGVGNTTKKLLKKKRELKKYRTCYGICHKGILIGQMFKL